MEILSVSSQIENLDCDGIILWNYSDNNSASIDRIGDSISSFFVAANFEGKKDQRISLFNIQAIKATRIVVVGLGKKVEANHEIVRNAAANAVRILQGLGCKHVGVEALNLDAQSTAEGIFLGLYKFDELKVKKVDVKNIEKITFSGSDNLLLDWEIGGIISKAQNITRRLAELPANIGTPSYFV